MSTDADTDQAAAVAEPPRRLWIVAPWWDLAYVVLTPLAIVPIVLILSRRWFTPNQISLAVISFASLGHHLPGFMRAYGDRELFWRFRWRFLLAPPLVFAVALLFSPPHSLATALGLPWHHLHGLELVLLFWGTWHALMQTFGFMRLYDVRRGQNNPRTARLDHWLCLTMFVWGVVFSDMRMSGIADAMWQSGLPLFGRSWLLVVRWIVGVVGLSVLAAYAADLVGMWRRGESLGWIKLLLAGTTGWFYWYTGRMSTNLLIGLAMFEIYHAVQYNAIVWIYNRKLLERAGERFGLLGFLFRGRWSMLGIYLAAIAAYGSIRLLAGGATGPVYWSAGGDTHQWLLALFVASSTLHFYFDGFIWKVSEKSVQQNLVDDTSTTARGEHPVPGLILAAKWAVILAIVAALLMVERSAETNEREIQQIEARIALTPNVPECQSLASRLALARGDNESAIENARAALANRPRSHFAYADLAAALLEAEYSSKSDQSDQAKWADKTSQADETARYREIRSLLEQAIQLEPRMWRYHADLGLAYEKFGDLGKAEVAFQEAARLQPDLERSQLQLANFYLRQGHAEEALAQATILLERYPKSWRSQLAWGSALSAIGRHQEAVVWLGQAIQHDDSAEPRFRLGLSQLQSGNAARAIKPLFEAIRRNPNHADALLQLGNAFYTLQKWQAAIGAYEKCRKLQPKRAELYANLGAALNQSGRLREAEEIYRQGLERKLNSPNLHYNLGILLWQTGQIEEGQSHIRRAKKLGLEIPPEVSATLQQGTDKQSTDNKPE